MKLAILVLSLLLVSPCFSQVASQFKGSRQIEKQIFTKILNKTNRHPDLGHFIGESGFFFSSSLLDLMGFYQGGVNNGEMTNGDPNAISFLIHYLVFSEVSEQIGNDCPIIEDPILSNEYKPEFLSVLKSVCSVEPVNPLNDIQYMNFWVGVHGYEAPLDELDAWKQFFSQHSYNTKEARLKEMTLLAMMNPFFFIQN